MQDADSFEAKAMEKLGLIKEIVPRYRTGYFSHIFSGGYSSGYYGYIWSDVLSADSFAFFKEKGIFDAKTAAAYREHILAAGGKEDPMTQYRRFRGKNPEIKPLLESRGFSKK